MDRKALYDLSYGVFLLSAKAGDRVNGCITNTCIQVASSPVRVAFSVLNGNLTCEVLKEGGVFLLNCAWDAEGLEKNLPAATDRKTILAAVAVISQLNPIPAQGFGSRESSSFVVPDAFIYSQNDSVTIELNKRALPRISVDEHYRIMLDSADNAELRDYLRQKLRQANDMIQGIQGRGQTLRRLLRYIADYQHAFFCGGELRTMTIQSAAEALEINPSTVSRAVQDKYIQFGGKVIPLRELFSSSVTYGEDGALSSVAIKQRLRVMIQSEDPSHPMSDEELAAALANDHIEISRRTVAKYRSQLQIPPASARRTRT